MSEKTMTKNPATAEARPTTRATLVRLSIEIAEELEDYRYQQQLQLRRRVTKRELIERALHLLIRGRACTP